MNFSCLRFAFGALTLGTLALTLLASDVAEPDIDGYTKDVAPFFKQHCAKCHSGDKAKAKLDLDKLNYDLTGSNKDLEKWQTILDRVQRGEMPPDDEKRPDAQAVAKATRWLKTELRKADPKLLAKAGHSKRHLPGDGNSVPHESLFGVAAKPGGASPARIWRLSPQAYTELTNAIFGKGQKSPLSQPFSLLAEDGLKDYAAAFSIDEPTTMQLYRNAKEIVAKQTSGKNTGKNGSGKAFGPLFETNPSTGAIDAAIRAQFDIALKRQPTT